MQVEKNRDKITMHLLKCHDMTFCKNAIYGFENSMYNGTHVQWNRENTVPLRTGNV